MIIAVTGHRPSACEAEYIVRSKLRTKMKYAKNIESVIVGMAPGTDLWAADEALDLGINVIAARPWATHEAGSKFEELYSKVTNLATKVVNVSDSDHYTGPQMYYARNEWMVDNATHVMSYMHPECKTGGTYACVQYAKKKGKPVANIYNDPPF